MMSADSSPPLTPPLTDRPRARRRHTPTEQVRRAQLLAVTIDVIARHGYRHSSLQRIADAAGITKAAVIYHYATKDALIRAAYDFVIGALTERVAAAVEAAPTPARAVDAYVAAMLAHMAEQPSHVRVIVEALDERNATGIEGSPRAAPRWRPLAAMIEAAVAFGEYRRDTDARLLAIVVGGAIDAVVAETLADPSFDLATATAELLALLRRATA